MRSVSAKLQAATFGLDDATSVFAEVRPRLFGIAYRMLGSWTEAEDIVQDVWLRWQGCDRSAVLNATAFLVTTTTRLAINSATSARARHESYVGRWLSEPVDPSDNPELGAERGEALELGVLLLLEKLSATERAAYVLREAFDYPYSKIAGFLQLTEVNARQLVSRAGKKVVAGRRKSVGSAQQRRLLSAFLAAARAGEFVALEEVFVQARHQSA
jgi:RNA polymerase sigma-70 factor (ECF subfamily)